MDKSSGLRVGTPGGRAGIEQAHIPEDLKLRPQWVNWRAERRDGKLTKVPLDPSIRVPHGWESVFASTIDPQTWGAYHVAWQRFSDRPDVDGIGFVFTADDPYIGIDLDHCRDPQTGTLEPWADDMMRRLSSYTEVSPSGTGLHIIVKGHLPDGARRKGAIEMYDCARYFTMTGQHVAGTPTTIEERAAELMALHASIFGASPPSSGASPSNQEPRPTVEDEVILARASTARNGGKFERLFRGDWTGHASQSEADLALCAHLVFYTGPDAATLDRLFRQSGLMREKWNEPHFSDGKTYGQATIDKALQGTREYYTWHQSQTAAQGDQQQAHDGGDQDEQEEQSSPTTHLEFPETAWRNAFHDYRQAMNATSEAPDSAHFSALWAVAAAQLRRRVSIYYAFTHYPNVFLVNYGPTGDSKTSASRQALRLLPHEGGVKLLRGVGSAEALGDWMTQAADGPAVSHLLFIEELATLLTRGGWEGSTLLSFFTETYDAPDVYEVPFRKNPVKVLEPTPTLIAGTTPQWFWKGMRELDIYGGFGNRLFFLTGTPKAPIPMPEKPNHVALTSVRNALDRLGTIPPQELSLDATARELWNEFYIAWKTTQWEPLTAAAVKRVPAYILKLAMLYSCFEQTAPAITRDQLAAAIEVGHYGARCADQLMQGHRDHNRQGQCEQRVLVALERRDLPAWKIHHEIGGRFTAQDLSLATRSLLATGAILEVGKTRERQPIFGLRGRRRTT